MKASKVLKTLLKTKKRFAGIKRRNIRMDVVHHGNYTVCMMAYGATPDAATRVMGIAKCNPTDNYNKDIGGAIAISRALDELV